MARNHLSPSIGPLHLGRSLRVIAAILTLFLLVFAMGRGHHVSAAGVWWDPAWDYRTDITVDAGGYARHDKPVEVRLNFTPLLQAQGESGAFDPNSIRVIEVDGDENLLDDAVPFQFDRAGDYHATNKARGTLTFLLTGDTAANATRRFHVYFDVTGKGFSAPSFTDQVTLTDGVAHMGYASIRLVTAGAEYFYHKPGGGFATLLDQNGNDWIDWNTAAGGAGDFRGIPNMVHPNDGGYFHPGRNNVTTTVLSDGPLKATFQSVSKTNTAWEVRWDVFPDYARMTVIRQGTSAFWWLYEGTPGGVLEPAIDRLTRSDGNSIHASGSWATDIPGDEWVFVTDPNVANDGRSLYLAHHQSDTKVDGYTADGANKMTIFGFGRSGGSRLLNTLPQQFTFGFTDETAVGSVTPVVNDAYKPLIITGENDSGDDPNPGPMCNPLPHDVLVSPKRTISIDGVYYYDEDVLKYDGANCVWSILFDGAAAELPASANVDALAVDGPDLYLSFLGPLKDVPGIAGIVDDSDVVKYSGGEFTLYLDGSNFGLATDSEDVDAIGFDESGDLLVSTLGTYIVNGLPKGQDEDLLRLIGGSWVLHFDGSHNAALGVEDVVSVDALGGAIYLSVLDTFRVTGAKGNGTDIFVCQPSSLGYQTTQCQYSLFWRSANYGLASFDAFDIE